MELSNLDLINECDGFPYYQVDPGLYTANKSTYYELRVNGHCYALGYVLPSVAEVFRGNPLWSIDDQQHTLTLTEGKTVAERSAAIEKTFLDMRSRRRFKVLDKWRGESFPVYGRDKEVLFGVERAAGPLLGVVTYGVHLTAYVWKNGEMKIWIPRRARTKQTYAGMLDNAAAGGIALGESAFESMVRECKEEASLPEDLVRKKMKACGCVTYFYIRNKREGGETLLLQPECGFVYDLELPEDVVPKPGDDEVEEFYLWTIDEVRDALAKGEFKTNCATVMIDFFIRHGIITAVNEKDYTEIVTRLHRRIEFPTL